ncbi:MAG: hypothetical protein WAP47_09270 [Candidatus Rokuibacteriota bacterium]
MSDRDESVVWVSELQYDRARYLLSMSENGACALSAVDRELLEWVVVSHRLKGKVSAASMRDAARVWRTFVRSRIRSVAPEAA